MKIIVVLFSTLFSCCGLSAQSWASYRDSALLYKQAGQVDAALNCFQHALKKLPADYAKGNDHIDLLKEIGGIFYFDRGQYKDALPYYQQAGKLLSQVQGKKADSYIDNTFVIGQLQYLLKQNAAAEKSYVAARNAWESKYSTTSKQYAGACNALGILYNDWSRFDKAVESHSLAMKIREQLFTKKSAPYAQSCNNLGALYWSLGQLDKAEPLALEAKTLRQHLADVPRQTYAISCVNLANIYRDMGKFAEAELLYIEAKDIREKKFTRQHDLYIQSCEILANLYTYMQRYKDAEVLYLEAKQLRIQNNQAGSFYYAQCCSNLAQLYMQLNRQQEAMALAMEALQVFERIGKAAESDKAITRNLLGALYFGSGNQRLSLLHLSKARKYWQKNLGTQHPFFNANTIAMARVYRANDDIKKADHFYRLAFESGQRNRELLFSFTAEQEKKAFVENMEEHIDELLSFYHDKMRGNNDGYPLQLLLQQKSSILTAARQFNNAVYHSNDRALIRVYDEWLGIKKQLSSLLYRQEQVSPGYMAALNETAMRLEKKLFRSASLLRSKEWNQQPDWKKIQPALAPGEAAIQFFNFNYFDGRQYTDSSYYAALVMTSRSKEPLWIDLFDQHKLEKLVAKKYAGPEPSVIEGKRGVVKLNPGKKADAELYAAIWLPLEPALTNTSKIYLIPSGLLNRISFPALAIDSARLLSDQFDLQQLLSIAELTTPAGFVLSTKEEVQLFGGINYNLKSGAGNSREGANNPAVFFDFLPGTEKEVKDIASLGLDKQQRLAMFAGDDATEDNFKQSNGMLSPAVLHIASHGFYFPYSGVQADSGSHPLHSFENYFARLQDPLLRCGLAFAGANAFADTSHSNGRDGILTAYEISTMNLSNTRLVVLSACETALGDIDGGEGVYGLKRAFKIAGVQYIILSLWSVPDRETAMFMTALYKNMFDGQPIEKAFHLAQMLMKNQFREEPEKWAAWILSK